MSHEKFLKDLSNQFNNYIKDYNLSSKKDCSLLARAVFDKLTDELKNEVDSYDSIESKNAVIEIIDLNSGELYRRYVELVYHENNNGMRLIGEDLSGKEQQIAFLSEHAIAKIYDLQGNGSNKPLCK